MKVGAHIEFVGPFSEHKVVVNGWSVPFLYAHPSEDESQVVIVIDSRLAATFTIEEAEKFVPFIADAIAVALGYGAHPRADTPRPLERAPYPRPQRMVAIDGIRTEEAEPPEDSGGGGS